MTLLLCHCRVPSVRSPWCNHAAFSVLCMHLSVEHRGFKPIYLSIVWREEWPLQAGIRCMHPHQPLCRTHTWLLLLESSSLGFEVLHALKRSQKSHVEYRSHLYHAASLQNTGSLWKTTKHAPQSNRMSCVNSNKWESLSLASILVPLLKEEVFWNAFLSWVTLMCIDFPDQCYFNTNVKAEVHTAHHFDCCVASTNTVWPYPTEINGSFAIDWNGRIEVILFI